MHEAQFYKKLENKKVKCELCPWFCAIAPDKKGKCRARKNIDGKLYSVVYGKPCSVAIDPIEKKPFFHFHPGTRTVSVATASCNLACDHCQNWEISQADPEETYSENLSPKELVEMALEKDCQGISYTYTEPTTFYEYAYDTAKLAKEQGLYNTFVSNGMINTEPLKKISKYLDAMNMDLKAFTEDFYKEICHGIGLEPIKQTAKNCKEFGIHLEITNLIIPTYNDTEEKIKELVSFVKSISPETPLHFSRFFPHYKMRDIEPTPIEVLEKAKKIAEQAGIEYVYIGNVQGDESTYCPKCNELLISRVGYSVGKISLKGKKCPKCGKDINIVI